MTSSPDDAPTSAADSRPGRGSLSIASIMLIMLLVVSIGSTIAVGFIGYATGTDSLRQAAVNLLVGVRDARAQQVETLFDQVQSSLLAESHDEWVVTAERAFLAEAAAAAAPAGAPGSGPDDATTARYRNSLSRVAKVFGYDDLLLIGADGTVIYSVAAASDLGTNLATGPYRYSTLADAFRSAMSDPDTDAVSFGDYGLYPPANGRPVGWAVAPLIDPTAPDAGAVGAIAVRLPSSQIDAIMTGNGDWAGSGLGATGESYLVGDDRTMRSNARGMIEDSATFAQRAIAAGASSAVAQQEVANGTSALLQPVSTEAAEAAFDGETGTVQTGGYLGGSTLTAYAPLDIPGLHWVIIAQLDESEAFAPVTDFATRLGITSAILVLVVSLLSVVLAQFAVRPLRRLRDAARRIAAGEQGVRVEAGESDELADVAAAFNDMSSSLELKASLLAEQENRNEELLRSLMPETLKERYKAGDRTIVDDHQEVTVLFADIVGFEEFSRTLDSAKALALLNDIVRSFDQAAQEHGVERVRTTRQGYLASCGLAVPRVDHARRTVEFALELVQILDRFGAKHGTAFGLRAGIDSGTATSGLVGQTNLVYDLWGDAVSMVFRVQGATSDTGIFLTQRVVDRIPATYSLTDAGAVESAGTTQKIWRLDPQGARAAAPAEAPA